MDLPSPASETRWISHKSALSVLTVPSVGMVVYRRPCPTRLARCLRTSPPDRFTGLRLAASLADLSAVLPQQCQTARLPNTAGYRLLQDDILSLARRVGALGATNTVQIRLERITGNACRLFHPDRVPFRLVCTYAGPGTQWLPEDACNRPGIGQGNNDLICRDWSRVQSLRPFWAGLMKGDLWPGAADNSGVVHRSPPVAGGQWRLFLSIDPLPAA